jgi:hypothetical protein
MRKANKWTVQLSLENNFCNAKYTVYYDQISFPQLDAIKIYMNYL